MRARRPAPLTHDVVEPLTRGAGTVLLGRTAAAVAREAAYDGQKKPPGELGPAVGTLTATPGAIARMTPLGCSSPVGSSRGHHQPLQSIFTPMATPSPWGSRQMQMFYRRPVDTEASMEPGQGDEDDDTFEADEQFEQQMQEQMMQQRLMQGPGSAPPPPPDAQHPSLGSVGHAAGTCKRCCFFPRGRCVNGYECGFCHYEHEKRKRKANKKKQMPVVGGRPPLGLYQQAISGPTLGTSVGTYGATAGFSVPFQQAPYQYQQPCPSVMLPSGGYSSMPLRQPQLQPGMAPILASQGTQSYQVSLQQSLVAPVSAPSGALGLLGMQPSFPQQTSAIASVPSHVFAGVTGMRA